MEICTAFGHRDDLKNITVPLREAVREMIEVNNVTTFICGSNGDADATFACVVREFRRENPSIKLILVKPYFSNELNTNKEYYEAMYDDIIVPEELANVFHKAAIKKRNRWVVDKCDYIIDCTFRDFGGAYDAVAYAKKQKKKIIKLFNK